MSKILITATKVISPDKKTLPGYNQVVYVESDKITILPAEGGTKSIILSNGYKFYVDAEVAEMAAELGLTEDFSLYT